MPRQSKPKPAELSITPAAGPQKSKTVESPDPRSSPLDLAGIDLSSFGGDIGPEFATLPPLPQSPPIPQSPGHQRDQSKTSAYHAKGRSASEQEPRGQIRQVKDDEEYRPGSSSMSKIYHLRKAPGSTPELSLLGSAENIRKQSGEMNAGQAADTRPQLSPHHSEDSASVKRNQKGLRNPLTRSKSIRRDSDSKSKSNGKPSIQQPPKTAPISPDWPGQSEAMLFKSKLKDRRGKSAERAIVSESEDNSVPEKQHVAEKEKTRFGKGSKNVVSKAVSTGGSLFNRLGKIGRSNSNTEKEIPDSEYVIKVINQPLVEQTRFTRISKDLKKCRDKTEFWMPSLPWRCIDYLNYNCETEGLYRVPGSGPQVKHWQRRFDTELDIDLLNEQELYDPNTIASMLKSWLRDLPTEIMPKTLQQELAEGMAKENADYQKIGQSASDRLRNTLSQLPPFNYYLLFAITCHLSLLLSHKEQNKMDLNNLSICIGPCLDLERWLFNYLVGDWKHCWQGCWTEPPWLKAEEADKQGLGYVQPTTSIKAKSENGKKTDNGKKTGHGPMAEKAENAENGKKATSLDDRAVYSSGSAQSRSRSREASRQGSHYSDARSAQTSPHRALENLRPDTYTPPPAYSAFTNGNLPAEVSSNDLSLRRPATAGNQSGSNSHTGTPTPKPSHNRSQSDFQLSPVKPSSPVDFPLTLRNQ
ncbi:hypothetical protein LTR37_016146 [Vermiconidia calcicola]|uniref:Uncharacterized protein n=1 Tax=Vermiconidia calcicola TaxID=1690605 RepID=A0ACC3MNV0_9PEZI|nr:hypothetical protein LTR37_016146 [Vermiconidia calcicola]